MESPLKRRGLSLAGWARRQIFCERTRAFSACRAQLGVVRRRQRAARRARDVLASASTTVIHAGTENAAAAAHIGAGKADKRALAAPCCCRPALLLITRTNRTIRLACDGAREACLPHRLGQPRPSSRRAGRRNEKDPRSCSLPPLTLDDPAFLRRRVLVQAEDASESYDR